MALSRFYQDHNQNFWQLAAILGSAQSIPVILVGGVLAQEQGTGTAISSICIGNLILWLIGWGVISMAAKGRKNAVENVQGYLGKTGAILMALILLTALLSWYIITIKESITALSPLFHSNSEKSLEMLGILMGLFVAILITGGIRVMKWVCLISFPFLFCFMVYTSFLQDQTVFNTSWSLSPGGIVTIAAIALPGMVNLPTFFRHSRSISDSLLALTLITIINAIFQIFTVFAKMTASTDLLNRFQGNATIFAAAFISITLICSNLVNLYFSSAALQTITPKLEGPLGYFLVGLTGTISYIFLQNSSLVLFFENLAGNFLTNFGIVLLISFLVMTVIKHRPRRFEQSLSFFCWIVGCISALTTQILNPEHPNLSLLAGFGGCVFAFLCIFFFEETVWSIKKLYMPKS